MDLLEVTLCAIGAFIALFILTKLTGKRQISEMSTCDYISSIAIGGMAAQMATSSDGDWKKSLIAMIIFTLFNSLLPIATRKSLTIRRLLTGKPKILFHQGSFYYANFKSAKINVNEFLMKCRQAGFFTLEEINTALLENNGQISFLPVTPKRPVRPEDLDLTPKQEMLQANVIIDGQFMVENLANVHQNVDWLKHQLHLQEIDDISDIILATCDLDATLHIYRKIGKSPKEEKQDIFI